MKLKLKNKMTVSIQELVKLAERKDGVLDVLEINPAEALEILKEIAKLDAESASKHYTFYKSDVLMIAPNFKNDEEMKVFIKSWFLNEIKVYFNDSVPMKVVRIPPEPKPPENETFKEGEVTK